MHPLVIRYGNTTTMTCRTHLHTVHRGTIRHHAGDMGNLSWRICTKAEKQPRAKKVWAPSATLIELVGIVVDAPNFRWLMFRNIKSIIHLGVQPKQKKKLWIRFRPTYIVCWLIFPAKCWGLYQLNHYATILPHHQGMSNSVVEVDLATRRTSFGQQPTNVVRSSAALGAPICRETHFR